MWGFLRRAGAAVVALVAVGVPAVAAVLLVQRAERAAAPPIPQEWAPAGSVVPEVVEPGSLVLRWSEQQVLVAPDWGGGLVQGLLATSGAVVVTGTPLATVGRIVRVAAHTSAPFDRPLQLGDVGTDVEELNSLLGQLHLPAGSGDTFTTRTRSGVSGLAMRLAGAASEVFQPGWVVYLPMEAAVIERIDLQVGSPAPSAGDPFVTLRPRLEDAVLTSREVAQTYLTSASPSAATEPTTDRDDPLPPSDVARATSIRYRDEAFGGTDERGRLSPGDQDRLAAVVPSRSSTASVEVVRVTGGGAVSVPSSAVVTGASGDTCVIARSPRSSAVRAVRVHVADSFQGVALVSGLDLPVEVAVAPALRLRTKCR